VAATNASEGAELVAQALRLARERARAGLGGAPHGVKFLIVPDQPVEYVIFRGADYAAREPQFDFSQTLPPAASLNFMSGDDEIIFAPGGGRPDDSLNLQITVAESGTKVVKVTNLGLVIVQ